VLRSNSRADSWLKGEARWADRLPTFRAARERPDSPVIGLTPLLDTARRMAVVWGVHAVVVPEVHSMGEAVNRAARAALTEGFAVHGDEIVVIAGVPFGLPGTTNALRVATVK